VVFRPRAGLRLEEGIVGDMQRDSRKRCGGEPV
jgi:hypothetical protein